MNTLRSLFRKYTSPAPHITTSGMAWRSSGTSNASLVDNLYKNQLVTTPEVREAFLRVDRADYCPDKRWAYEDSPQSIGHHATISAPHMHASAAESLLPYLSPRSASSPAVRVLDVGSGSGYLTQILAELVFGPHADGEGEVIGIEHISALRELGAGNMTRSARGKVLLEAGKVKFVLGDGRRGWPGGDGGRLGFDAIHVGAGAKKIHQELVDQLRKPGRMFIPVEDDGGGRGDQYIWVVDKDEQGKVDMERLYGVRYVPLTDAPTPGG